MKHSLAQWSTALLVSAALVGCGGGNGNGTTPAAPVVPVVAANSAIAAASLLAANDSATNPGAAFTVVQNAGIPAVTITGAPKVNFAIFSDGKVKADLTITNVSFAIAKLVPASNGNPDQWVNYVYRTRAAATAATGTVYTDAVKATLTSPKFPVRLQAFTDPKQSSATLLAAQLVYNADGYYTYTFSTDIKDETQTKGQDGKAVKFEPNLTHRVAIQLSYKNAAGDTVLVNPYFDFTVDANGKSVAVTDPSKTRKMTDVASCNGCHDKLIMHGGRVDTQFCVMCHNPGTTDPNSGNVLVLANMVHKIHAGRLLSSQVGSGGENFTVRTADFSEVGFPQDLRNCSKCHSAANPSTPQGDNWKTQPSQAACLSCHVSAIGSTWETLHKIVSAQFGGAGTPALALPNSECVRCHGPGTAVASERVHFNQIEANAAKYKMNIESVALNDTADHKARSVTVKYFLSDPTNGNAAYKLVTADCTGTTTITCASTTKFGNLRFYLAYQNVVGQSDNVTEYSAYNNGGSTANAYAYKGTNDGSNHYTVSIPLPDDTAISVAKGTARVVSIGQIKEPQLEVSWATDPRPEVVPTVLLNTAAQHTYKELSLDGKPLLPRRTVVATEKCNVCHGFLGTTSGSNTLANGFHTGARNIVEACVTCHDPNRMSATVMADGSTFNESYQLKRMVHGVHGGSKRIYPFTVNNLTQGIFDKLTSAPVAPWITAMKDSFGRAIGTSGPGTGGVVGLSTVENFTSEVFWPGYSTSVTTNGVASTIVNINCNACHVNNSYQRDQGQMGAVIKKDTGVTDPNLWKVISPKAATCTACHDGKTASGATVKDHVTKFGGAAFGDQTQAQIAGLPRESCDDCHGSGGVKSVDLVHRLK